MIKIGKLFAIHSLGIEFDHHGDAIIWTWWWKRTDEGKYISLSFDSRFKYLYLVDQMWGGYFEACSRVYPEEKI